MKKLSKIFAVVLCLTMVLAMLPLGVSAATENCVEFTVDSLGLGDQSYSAGTTTVGGVGVEWIQLGNYGNGIQMRDKDGKTSMFWNTSALGTGITKIELTYSGSKDVTYGNDNAVIFTFGNEAKGNDYSSKLSTTAGTKTYTITPNSNTYTYFYMEHDLGYTFYWDSIKVYYNGSVSGGNTGNDGNDEQTPSVGTVSIANGEYVICAPAYNKALSSEKALNKDGSVGYYNAGVDVTISGSTVTGYGDTEKWIVTNNADGTITISQNGQNLALANSKSSMNLGEVNDKWIVEDAGNGLVYIKNAVRGNYIEWYASYGNWSSYNVINSGSEDLFALSFISIGVTTPVEPETPSEPETPAEPEVETDLISDALAAADGEEFTVKGKVVLIDGKNIYLQDSTGGICARASENVEDLAIGDTVIATGSKSVYNGLPQLGSATYQKVSSGKISVKETTIADLTAADVCTYVKLSNVIVSEVYDNDGAYSLPNITVTDGENEIQIYKAVVAKNEDGTWAVQAGDSIDVYAAVSCYNDKLQLRNTNSSEIVAAGFTGPDYVGPDTGDMPVAGLIIAMMAAAGCAVVISKKKEF